MKDLLRMCFGKSKLPLVYEKVDDTTAMWVYVDNAMMTVCFGGTRPTWVDWLANFFTSRIGGIHAGFLEQWTKIMTDVGALVDEHNPYGLRFVGWSQGGAIATIALLHWKGHIPVDAITFAAPRCVGNDIAHTYPHHLLTRVESADDWVVRMPPRFMGYSSVGKLHQIVGVGHDPSDYEGKL
jgi:pimeloyl-ACP methyl ester carboxylesterase